MKKRGAISKGVKYGYYISDNPNCDRGATDHQAGSARSALPTMMLS